MCDFWIDLVLILCRINCLCHLTFLVISLVFCNLGKWIAVLPSVGNITLTVLSFIQMNIQNCRWAGKHKQNPNNPKKPQPVLCTWSNVLHHLRPTGKVISCLQRRSVNACMEMYMWQQLLISSISTPVRVALQDWREGGEKNLKRGRSAVCLGWAGFAFSPMWIVHCTSSLLVSDSCCFGGGDDGQQWHPYKASCWKDLT